MRDAALASTPSPPRVLRVRKAERNESLVPAAMPTAMPAVATRLAPDALGYSLRLAATLIARVRAGQSLNDVLPALDDEPPVARAAARDVAYGVLRRHGWGDFVLARLMQKPLTHGETHALLLAALYRLETRPDAQPMVVDQAVAASGELSGGAFKGLVNGVLRNYLRRRDELQAALETDEAARYQFPAWWLKRLQRAYPERWRDLVESANRQPPMTLRVNRRRTTRDDYAAQLEAAGLAAQAVGPFALRLEKAVPVDTLPGFADGWVSVQDLGAQRAAELLAPQPGARVLDACAAPGGKTAHLLEMADLDLLALDVDALRLQRVDAALRRLHLTATTRAGDCANPEAWWDGRPFDAILADVPCSASGVVRRHPDIKLLRRDSDIRRLARTQATLLDALWPLLKPGGRLLYATCSVFPEENGAQIDAFRHRQADASCLFDQQLLPGADHDGFYYALLRKMG